MYINVIWVLLTIGLSYLLVGNILYACEAGVVFLMLWALVRAISDYLHIRQLKQYGKLKLTRRCIERSLVLGLLFLLTIAIAVSHIPYIQEQLTIHSINHRYHKMPIEMLKKAEAQLKNHPNDMHYCALLTMPSLKKNDPKALATYLAYYDLSKVYCNQYWDWGRNHCNYLKHLQYSGYSMELVKNIQLCEIAKSKHFTKTMQTGSKNHD